MATVHATRLRRGEGALSRTRRGAELHKPRTLDTGRGSERGNAVVRLHPHPAEWRIGSPLIEGAWYEAARTERNNGVGHGTPSGAMPGRLCSPPIPTMASSTRRWNSTNRLFPSFADGPASQTVRHSRKIGWEAGACPIPGLRASGFRSIPLPDQWDKQRRREFRPQTEGNPHRGHKPGPGRSFLGRPVECFAEHPSEQKRAFNIIDRKKSNFR